MAKIEKNTTPQVRRRFLLWISLLLAFAMSCQQDELLFDPTPDPESQYRLKVTQIEPGKYTGTYEGGEWLIALPENWNSLEYRHMVFYAHGMVDPVPYEPVQLPTDSIEGEGIEDIVTGMGMGYATTSYRDNGLIILDAIEDVKKLLDEVNLFFEYHSEFYLPDYLFLAGPSEGGLVTVKTIEKYPKLFDGAIAICGPIGNFYNQLQYNGDFHVLFNYFFGAELSSLGIDLGNPKDGVAPQVMQAWKAGSLKEPISGILASNPGKVAQLIRCAKVKVDLNDPIAVGSAVMELLRFNIMLTNNVQGHMDGVPFNNKWKWYRGSNNDWLLNRSVQRILDDSFERAKRNVRKYETSGDIEVPLVTIHTTGDHIIPFWHNPVYRYKIFRNRDGLLHTGIPVINYGHCTINKTHVMAALAIVIVKARLIDRYEIESNAFESTRDLETFKDILREQSIEVEID